MHPIEKGRELEHAIYGYGVVVSSDEERTVVEFQEVGRKLFVTTMMNARLIEGRNKRTLGAGKALPRRPVNGAVAHSRTSQRTSDSTIRVLIQRQLHLSLERLRRAEQIAEIGRRIRSFRCAAGMPRTELHRRSGVPMTSLEFYERGVRKPSSLALRKISAALGLDISNFVVEGKLDAATIRL